VNHCPAHHFLPVNLPHQSDHTKIFSHHLKGPTQMLYYHMNKK
jgi:hypothetical protein